MEHVSDADLRRRQRQIAAEIANIGFCLPGSLVERTGRCGNAGCSCHSDPSRRHGPYRSWTRRVAGKTTTRNLTPEQAQTYEPWFDNAARLHHLVRELEHLGAIAAARAEGWAEPPQPPPDRRRRAPAADPSGRGAA